MGGLVVSGGGIASLRHACESAEAPFPQLETIEAIAVF
jgi:hypothetical protein